MNIDKFLCSYFNNEDGREKKQHFRHILIYYFKKGKNATEMQNKILCIEKVLWQIEYVKSGLLSFALEIPRWMTPQGQVDLLKLIAIKLRH